MRKVSIIVPAYNEGVRIKKCLNSLINQSYKNIEIIVINDGSTDNTLDILKSYDDNRLVILTQKNKGQGAARNLGIKKASGDYLMFVDADDYVDKDIVKKLLNVIKDNNSDIAVCDLYKQYGEKNILFKNFNYFTSDNVINFMMSHPGPVGRLYDRNLFLKNNISFVEGLINEDLGTIPLLGIYAKKIAYLKEPLYYYVIHENSTTQQTVYSKKLEDIFEILEHLKKEFKKRANSKYDNVIEYLYVEHLLYSASLKFIDFGDMGIRQINRAISIVDSNFPNWKDNLYFKNRNLKFKCICYIVYNKHFRILKVLKKLKK